VNVGNSLLKLLVLELLALEDGRVGCHEKSRNNYQHTLGKIPEE
jgi:hypothetical protein